MFTSGLIVSLTLLSLCPTLDSKKKFFFLDKQVTWEEARLDCWENHADLAMIRSHEEFVEAIKISENKSFWIGLFRETLDSAWTWSVGETLQSSSYGLPFNAAPWQSDEPDNLMDENCAAVADEKWFDVKCDLTHSIMCYENVILVKENRTWEEALEGCRTRALNLSVIHPYGHYLFDLARKDDIIGNKDAEFLLLSEDIEEAWVGVRFMAGEWLWMDGASVAVEATTCPTPGSYCGTITKLGELLTHRNCSERRNFFCAHLD